MIIGDFVLANQIQPHVHARLSWHLWVNQSIDVHIIYQRCEYINLLELLMNDL
jgi:hypothetical protein